MFDKFSDAITALHRVPTQLLVVVLTATGLILFVPPGIASKLAVDNFRDHYRLFLGPAFILACSWIIARITSGLLEKRHSKKHLQNLRKQLSALTQEEKEYLAVFIFGGKTTIYAPVSDGIIGGLLARKIVYRASNIFSMIEGVPYNLQPWAREYLNENPDLLEGPEGIPLTPTQQSMGPW